MIQSFADADTQQLFREEKNRHFNAVARVALRKLIQMNRAGKLDDLKVPPGNRLEALKGSLAACICPTRKPRKREAAAFRYLRFRSLWRKPNSQLAQFFKRAINAPVKANKCRFLG